MNKTYIPAILSLVILAVLHYYGNHFYLYVKVDWYDVMMHILGGLGVGLSVYWILKTFFKNKFVGYFWPIVAITFLSGLAWEIMETYYNIAGGPVGSYIYYVDTIKDLIDDTIGAVLSFFIIKIK